MSHSHSARDSDRKAFLIFLHNAVRVLNHHLDVAYVGKWARTERLPAPAGHHSEKVETVNLRWRFCQYFPTHDSSLSNWVCHSSCKYPSRALWTLSLISYDFLSSLLLYSLSFSCYLQEFTRKFHFSVTLLMFSLYTHSVCCFLSFVFLPLLSAMKWRCGRSQTQVCSIYTVQLEWFAVFGAPGLLDPWREGLIRPLSPPPSTAGPAGPPGHVPAHCPKPWPHAAGRERWCRWKEWAGGGGVGEWESLDKHLLYWSVWKAVGQKMLCCSLTSILTCKWISFYMSLNSSPKDFLFFK